MLLSTLFHSSEKRSSGSKSKSSKSSSGKDRSRSRSRDKDKRDKEKEREKDKEKEKEKEKADEDEPFDPTNLDKVRAIFISTLLCPVNFKESIFCLFCITFRRQAERSDNGARHKALNLI